MRMRLCLDCASLPREGDGWFCVVCGMKRRQKLMDRVTKFTSDELLRDAEDGIERD